MSILAGMIGTCVNGAAIVAGGAAGLLLGQRVEERHRSIILQAVALFVAALGLRMALKGELSLIPLISLAVGGLLGEWAGIESRLEAAGGRLKRLAGSSRSDFVGGFVNASLVFCVGAMAVLGSIEDGLRHDPSILYAKASIDGVFAAAAAAGQGAGVLFSALSVLLYQGALTLLASRLAPFLTPPVVDALSATGGLLIFAIGLNALRLTRIPLGNFLPAVPLCALLKLWLG